ncbi:MAG: histidine phosphatase family protein [Proteobacteria bacterium]|nr:histidine phosphatase family protein [Pseudomonadota bacterium]
MFELILMRHAKSDWHSHTADIDRPLNDRGVGDAVLMGAYLKRMNLLPDTMVISSAQRTQETASLLLKSLQVDEKNIIFDRQLYLADRDTLRETIEIYAREDQCLLILAHNPGMDYIVDYLASSPPSLSSSGKLMTTCAAACFTLDSLEALKKPGQGVLKSLIRPKEIVGSS